MPQSICPALKLSMTGDQVFDTLSLKGQLFVLYFYPKDNTSGCTVENSDFRDLYTEFMSAHCQLFGVSRDSIKSHEGFRNKLGLPFPLVSDPDEQACQAFGVIKQKKMYGKEVRGIERSTFVINALGEIIREWRGVKVPNHATEVLAFVQTLK